MVMSLVHRPLDHPSLAALFLLVLVGFRAGNASAATILDTSFNGKATTGYDAIAAGNPYIINAPATFNNNTRDGLSVQDGSIVTVNGGTFSRNTNSGIAVQGINVTTLSVNAGSFTENSYGIFNNNSEASVAVYGGTFGGHSISDLSANLGPITLYGTFSSYGPLTGSGSFTGRLQNEPAAQTFTYRSVVGSVILAPVTVPEPSSLATLGGLGLLGLRRRRDH